MKIVAFYLPQFHEVEENNKWWGNGFTEWTNVKKAKSLYKGHSQPLEPYENNYYNLLDKETVEWQSKLAEKYGVYGFCYYHYWFEGRKILEKPAENLLNWKDINKRFCFCWANHDWKKTWNGTMEMLIKQGYGDEVEWEEHFRYLLKFFKDDRYIKIDNKPVLMIFSPKDIPRLDERIEFYDMMCKQNGFDGIFFIESINNCTFSSVSKKSEGVLLREPNIGITKSGLLERVIHKMKRSFRKNYLYKPMIFKYKTICNNSLEFAKNFESDKRVFLGSFTSWDSTPRHERRGHIVTGSTSKELSWYLEEQKKLIEKDKEEMIFINAWNEWCEGMYLEPDKKNKYSYLEAIAKISRD